jgi:hypothetical protein
VTPTDGGERRRAFYIRVLRPAGRDQLDEKRKDEVNFRETFILEVCRLILPEASTELVRDTCSGRRSPSRHEFLADRTSSFPENLYLELFINLPLSLRRDKIKCK